MNQPLLPVTIIGGYLGAGKTTLVNHLLRNANGARLAVLVNEFGALPIDEDLIEAQDDDLISIAGGCVCCSYGSDLTAALMELKSLNPKPDHVLLEASGVALPGAIAGSVSLLSGYSTDGIVIVTDAEILIKNANHKFMGDTVTRQLSDADIVILNKADLVAMDDVQSVKDFAQSHAANAVIVEAIHGVLPPDVVLQTFAGERDVGAIQKPHDTQMFDSESFSISGNVDPQALVALLTDASLGLVRAKGFIKGLNGRIFAVQCVARRGAAHETDYSGALGLVCIGLKPDFDATQIANKLRDLGQNALEFSDQ